MAGLRPYQGDEEREDHTSPEALLISAFLHTGSFDPDRNHLTSDMILSWRRLWDFCLAYQAQAGEAPPVSLVRLKFPDFTLAEPVSVPWAANAVRELAAQRALRTSMAAGAAALGEGDLRGAYELLEASMAAKPRGFARSPADVFDHALLEDRFDQGHLEVPWPTLQRVTHGGVGTAELWYVGARFSNGKTFSLCRMAARAAETGASVGYASFEMPAAQIGERILAGLCGSDSALFAALTGSDISARKTAQDQLLAGTPGRVAIYDPSHGAIATPDHIRDMCVDHDIVLLDHVGLMHMRDGKRAVDDWRVMASISNQLREITLATDTSVVAAAQINRAGENDRSPYPPKAKDLAQSDALGQDADVIITQKKMSSKILVMGAEKVRNGPTARWWSRFDPRRNRFMEVSYDEASEQMSLDGDTVV
jgi:hypothetical protein